MSNTLSDYNLLMVLLSYAVATFGAWTGLLTAQHIRKPGGGIHFGWLGLSALLLGGCAVWAMHFIGMLAYRPGVPVTYDTQLTLYSFLLPTILFGVGLYTVFRWRSLASTLISGAILGLGVAGMHYTGMAGMRLQAEMTHATGLTVLSVVIAVVAAIAALYLVLNARGVLRWASAPVMGLAVTGMHYTGMAAMSLTPSERTVNYFTGALTPPFMLVLILLVVTAMCLVSAYLALAESDRRERQDLPSAA